MSSGLTPQAVEANAPANLWANRRAAIRYSCRSAAAGRVTVVGDYAARRASIQDISLGGVALRVARPLEPGTQLLIQLHNEALGLTYALAARVAHSTRLDRRRWVVGCSFRRQLSSQELESLL